MYLPDINFWLALAFQSHAHHRAAKDWIDPADNHSCCFCRITQLGFLRLATNRKAFPIDALSMLEAWSVYEQLFRDERIAFAEEPDNLESIWQSFTQGKSHSTNVWSDAYLAAFSQAADMELISFDKGFSQYTKLRHTILTANN